MDAIRRIESPDARRQSSRKNAANDTADAAPLWETQRRQLQILFFRQYYKYLAR
jgi:hypothetical protein